MKVVHLCSDFDKFHVGLSDALNDSGVSSEIVAYKLRKSRFREVKSNSPVTKINSSIVLRRTPFFHLSRVKSTYKVIKKNIHLDCNIIHAHMLFSDGFLAYNFYSELGIKYIIAVRNSDINNSTLWAIPWLKKIAISVVLSASRLVFISPSYKEKLIARLGEKYTDIIESKSVTLPNGISSFWNSNKVSAAKNIKDNNKCINFICVGDVCENKNQLVLAQHLNEFSRASGFEVRLYIAGKVVSESYFEDVVSFDFVDYCGVLDPNKLLELYSVADIFVLISQYETFGLVYPESMTQALPLIYTRGQGIDGYYEAGVIGYPVNPHSYSDFENAVYCILEKYNKISASCLILSSSFTWPVVASSYHSLYSEILND